MGGGKNVHRNLYNEEFHYAGLDIHDTCVCMCGARVLRVHMYAHTYTRINIYRNIERRASSTEIRSVYICRQPPSLCAPRHPPLPRLFWLVHESRRARKFFVGPIFRFAYIRRIVFET